MSPGATVNRISGGKVIEKKVIELPKRVYRVRGTVCINPNCISHPSAENKERGGVGREDPIITEFYLKDEKTGTYRCRFCERKYTKDEILVSF